MGVTCPAGVVQFLTGRAIVAKIRSREEGFHLLFGHPVEA
jgi:hypothetical protein